jgi:hypothetical protein
MHLSSRRLTVAGDSFLKFQLSEMTRTTCPPAVWAITAAVLLLAGCGDGVVDWTVDSAEPFVPGIEVRGGANEYLGEYGNPQRPPAAHSISVETAYPNPAYIGLSLEFTVRNEGEGVVTVVPASGPNLSGGTFGVGSLTGPLNVYGGTGTARGPVVVRRIELQLREGRHLLTLDLRDETGSHVSDGYYRIYLRMGGEVQWWDVLVDSNYYWYRDRR